MRVSINGKEVAELDPRLERKLVSRHGPERAEGVVRTTDEMIEVSGRTLRISYGVVTGVAAVILVVVLYGAATWEPRDLIVVGPLVALAALAIGAMLIFVYRRRMARTRATVGPRLARLARAAPPGTAITADAAGIAIGGQRRPWSDYAIERVKISQVSVSEGDDAYYIETLFLSASGGGVVLDALAISHGRTLAEIAWRTLRSSTTGR